MHVYAILLAAPFALINIRLLFFSFPMKSGIQEKCLFFANHDKDSLIIPMFCSRELCIFLSQNGKFDNAVNVWVAGFDLACGKYVNIHLHCLPKCVIPNASLAFFIS